MIKIEKGNITNKVDELFNCSRCGSCLAVCPVYRKTLNESFSPRGKLSLIEALSKGVIEPTERLSDILYTCTLCNYCYVECPSGVLIKDLFEAVRLDLIGSKKYPKILDLLKEKISNGKNVTFDSNEGRLDWVKQLPGVNPEDLLKENAEVIYFVGCVSSFSPRAFSIPRSIIKLLKYAKADFGLLGEEEWCCGFPLLSAGMHGEAEEIADYNIKKIKQKGAKKIITSCPTCYHTWKHEYPKIASEKIDFKIMHVSEYLMALIDDGKLKPSPLDLTVTYHDPCDLGRNSGIYEIPREVIKSIPNIKLNEMEQNREQANCCGGGGNLESINEELAASIASDKVEEIEKTGADVVISACQQCERTIHTQLRKKKKELKKKVKTWDLTELLLKSIEAKGE